MPNALMRTLVPAIYGWLIHLVLGKEATLPQWANDLLSIVFLALVYLLLRYLEAKWRWIGVLLGWIGAPSYSDGAKDQVDQAQAATLTQLQDELGRFGDYVVGILESRMHGVVKAATDEQTAAITETVKATAPASGVPNTEKPAEKKATAPRKRPAKKATPRPPAKKAALPKPVVPD